jgi:acetoin utilization protein AcuB
MMNEYVRSIMTTNDVTLQPNDSLAKAREVFLKNRTHHIPVLNGKKLVGILTSWDIFKLGNSAAECANMAISEVMTTKIAVLDPDQHIGAAAEVFMEHLFNAVPIVNDEHEYLGMVTTYEVLKYEYEKEYPHVD